MKFEVYGQKELAEILIKKQYENFSCVSITNPGKIFETNPEYLNESYTIPSIVEESFDSLLKLQFWDADSLNFFDYIQITENEIIRRIPQKEDIEEIISFYNKTKESSDGYVVHCWRGISRSAATMLCIMYLYFGDEDKAINELYRVRPDAQPLWLIVSLFDEIMGTRLLKRINEIELEKLQELKRKLEANSKNKETLWIKGLI